MINQKWKRLLALALVLCLTLGMLPTGRVSAQDSGLLTQVTGEEREALAKLADASLGLDEAAEDAPADDTPVRVFIVLRGKSALEQGYAASAIASATAYTDRLLDKQAAVISSIETKVLHQPLAVRYQFTVVANAISATVPYGAMEEIAALPGVEQVCQVPVYETCQTEVSPMTITTGDMVGSYDAWETGYTGAGMRIAVIDTGLDLDHPSFDPQAYDYALEQLGQRPKLLEQTEIEAVLPKLTIAKAGVTAADLYRSTKVAFGYNYIDGNLDITHDNDAQGDHGTHVSGIATANRYIRQDGVFVSAADTVLACGIAPEAQLVAMKVFGQGGGAFADDYMAAIQDAIYLGCDAVNLSLGSTGPGFTAPGSQGVAYAERLFQSLTQTDTVVTISAGNAYSAGLQNASGTDLHRTQDPDLNTVGSPGSFENGFTVASVTNSGLIGPYLSVKGINASYTLAGIGPADFQSWDSLDESGEGTSYPFVFLGDPTSDTDTRKYALSQSDFDGTDVEGKIVLLSRGSNAFSEKHSLAANAGAMAVIIYNNTSGTVNMDLSASTATIPCIFMTQKDMQRILAVTEQGADGSYGGVMTVNRTPTILENSEDGYRMSDFSSWGVPGDLSLKPEITAPGGNIYSTLDGGAYGAMSGTSMAAPAMAGLSALTLQYIRENDLAQKTGLSARALAQALLMSTAVPLTEESGLPYSPRKQGAGLANAYKAVSAQSYLLVGAVPGNDGKVKIELGDDPNRTGSYQFTFRIYNISQEPKTYAFGSDVLTESVETIDGVDYIGESAYALSPKVRFAVSSMPYDLTGDNRVNREDAMLFLRHCNGSATLPAEKLAILDLNGDGRVTLADARAYLCQLEDLEGTVLEDTGCTVAPGDSATVTVTMELSANDRAYLNENFENGIYVDGFVYVRESAQTTQEGVILENADLSLPFLAYYGSWSEPNMLEDAWYYDEASRNNSYSGGFNAAVIRVDGQAFGLGQNPFTAESGSYLADRNAISPNGDGLADNLAAVWVSLLRNAAELTIRIESQNGDQVYYEETQENLSRAFYYMNAGAWMNAVQPLSLGWAGTDAQGAALPDGAKAMICVTAVTEYGGQGQTWQFPITVDRTAPEADMAGAVLDSAARALTVTVSDSQYLADAALLDSTGTTILQRLAVDDSKPGASCELTLDLQNVWSTCCYLAVSDYAMNTAYYKVDLSQLNPTYEADTFYGYCYAGDDSSGWASFTADTTQSPKFLAGGMLYNAAEYADGTVYAVTDSDLYAMRLGEFSPTKIGSLELSESSTHFIFYDKTTILDMAYDYSTQTMYALGLTLISHYFSYVFLYTLDLDTGMLTQVGTDKITGTRTSQGVNGLACDLQGNLYCVERGNAMAELYRLELVDGEPVCTRIGNTGYGSEAGSGSSMAFDHHTETLYWINLYLYFMSDSSENLVHSLIRLDTQTGKGTKLANTRDFRTVGLFVPYDRNGVSGTIGSLRLPETSWLFEHQSTQLTPIIRPANALNQDLIWSSSDETVATVDENGVVTALKAGTATITVTAAAAPKVSASCALTVHAFDGKAMTGFLADTGTGQPGWVQFNAAAPEQYKVLQETPGLQIVAACLGEGVIYASGYDAEHPHGALYVLDSKDFTVKQCYDTQLLFSGMKYSALHNAVLFSYQTYFGFVPLEDLTLDDQTYPAGAALYFDLASFLGDDSMVAMADTMIENDLSIAALVLCASGKTYSMFLNDSYGLSAARNVDLRVTSSSELNNALYYSHSKVSGEVLYYSMYSKTTHESTLYAVTHNSSGSFEPLRLGAIGGSKAPLTAIFVDYLAEAGIQHGELPEFAAGEAALTLDAAALQAYEPSMTEHAQP